MLKDKSCGRSWRSARVRRRPWSAAILLDGAPVREEDSEGWRHVAAVIANTVRQREVRARWDAFAREIGAPTGVNAKSAVDFAGKVLRICDDARGKSALLVSVVTDTFSIETLANDPTLCARRRQANPGLGDVGAACGGRTGSPSATANFPGR